MIKKYLVKETFPWDFTYSKDVKVKCNVPIGTILELNLKDKFAVVKARHNENVVFIVSNFFGEKIQLNNSAIEVLKKYINKKILKEI